MRFFLWPVLLFGGLFRILIVIAFVVLIVRLVSRRHYGYAGHWHGHAHHGLEGPDPRRIAAMRFAAGRIDRAEFDRIMSTLDASEHGAPTPPAQPQA